MSLKLVSNRNLIHSTSVWKIPVCFHLRKAAVNSRHCGCRSPAPRRTTHSTGRPRFPGFLRALRGLCRPRSGYPGLPKLSAIRVGLREPYAGLRLATARAPFDPRWASIPPSDPRFIPPFGPTSSRISVKGECPDRTGHQHCAQTVVFICVPSFTTGDI